MNTRKFVGKHEYTLEIHEYKKNTREYTFAKKS
jgi:hypothetical protein